MAVVQVPLLLFSAGIADIIQEALSQQARMPSTCHIVSNEMLFDGDGLLTGELEPERLESAFGDARGSRLRGGMAVVWQASQSQCSTC